MDCPRCGATVPTGARFCPSCGNTLTQAPAAEERKVASVLFVDLVGSTALGERLDPERTRAVLQAYFSTVASAVEAWGGAVEKYIGDAVVAVFGVPRTREDDAIRAVSSAAEILERVTALAADVARDRDIELLIRVGVETGEVIAPTEIRADRPMVTGDAVNTAARLQAAAEPGSAIVGERTFQATRGVFRYDPPVELELRGKSAPVTAHRLRSRIQGAVESGPPRNLEARIIGRERELAVIGGLIDEALESRAPRLAVIYGPAGIGKSRLVREAVMLGRSERPDLVTLRGRCPAVGDRITYWPLAEIVRAACGISLDDDGADAERRLRERVADLLGSPVASEQDIEETVHALALTAGIALASNPLERARPLAAAVELARRWPQFVSALAARGPVVVVIEDLHWASERAIDIVEKILARSNGPILLVMTARPEFAESQPGFVAGRPDVATIALRPLDRRQTAGLLDGLLPGRRLTPELETEIVSTAEGNPLFIEEIVSRLVEQGSLVRDAEGWRMAGDSTTVAIPDSIQALLAARIDALPETERRVLREASVIGRVFWDAPLVGAVAPDAIDAPLTELERRGLVALRPTSTLSGQTEYTFKHALIRDVAYGGLSLARRARAHAAVARWLETVSPDRPDELAELVAYHLEQALGEGADLAWGPGSAELAEVRRDARRAFLLAGRAARRRYALVRAVALDERAVELAETPEERAIALEALGDDHDAGYDGDLAVAPWKEALEIRRVMPGGGPHVARLSMKIAHMAAIMWGAFTTPVDPDEIDATVDLGLAADPDPEVRAWLQMLRAAAGNRVVAFHRQDRLPPEVRRAALEEARAYADTSHDTLLGIELLHVARAILILDGDIDGSLAATRRQLEMSAICDDPRERHFSLIEAGLTLSWVAGEAREMVEPMRRSLVLAHDLRPHDVNHSTCSLMSALFLAGEWDAVPPVIDEHIAAFEQQRDTSCPFAMAGFPLAATFFAHRGEPEQARQVEGTFALLMPENEWPIGLVEACQAMAALALGDAAAARDGAQAVIDAGDRNFSEEPAVELAVLLDALVALEDRDGLGRALPIVRARQRLLAIAEPTADRAEAFLLAGDGRTADAVALLERAIGAFDRLAPFEAARTREMLASLDADSRAELLQAALATYERLGARPAVDRVKEGDAGGARSSR